MLATLTRIVLLIAAPSYEADAVKLPTCVATVLIKDLVTALPAEARSVIALLDTHPLDSVAVPLSRLNPDATTTATDDPITVTLTPLVVAVFVCPTELTTVASYVVAALALPTCTDDVPATTRLRHVPAPVLHTTLDDDRQIDTAPPLDASRARDVIHDTPLCRPTTVTLCDPVIAALLAMTLLNAGPSNVSANVNVPSCCPLVATACFDAPTPDHPFTRNDESDTQVVDAAPVPNRDRALYCTPPISVPTTVTLAAPVDPMFVRTTLLGADRT